jgi:hypothetical protein
LNQEKKSLRLFEKKMSIVWHKEIFILLVVEIVAFLNALSDLTFPRHSINCTKVQLFVYSFIQIIFISH